MAEPSPSLTVRRAVRDLLARTGHESVAVAVSGGADSLALAAVTAGLAKVKALIVDHQLQAGSAEVAENAAEQLRGFGIEPVIIKVDVTGSGGMEAAARRARYAAFRETGHFVLLGHTLDDQAETVLLGLGRGSGPRSIAGMRELDPPWGRPLLKVRRADTERVCRDLGLRPWSDPHNTDPRFQRVRLRAEVIPLMEEVLQGGVVAALGRTADQLQDDLDALDVLAEQLRKATEDSGTLQVAALRGQPAALRRRVLRGWLKDAGVLELTSGHLLSVDALVGEWRGQGGVWLPGGFVTSRSHGRLTVTPPA